ncbi:hypothetical protein FNV43_RR20961 [Rhamnella rubrinervis]|uniref:Uncharacterized protein n=1 Tax=Rhamnella rubrinervis TaxID=2594499 RepID=A0A8K0DWY3_9ROSA|nr:hypothetical protein FNV43_RR20961 [Rhamnella rubrinervis]
MPRSPTPPGATTHAIAKLAIKLCRRSKAMKAHAHGSAIPGEDRGRYKIIFNGRRDGAILTPSPRLAEHVEEWDTAGNQFHHIRYAKTRTQDAERHKVPVSKAPRSEARSCPSTEPAKHTQPYHNSYTIAACQTQRQPTAHNPIDNEAALKHANNQLEPSRTARHDARNTANDTPTTQGPKIEDDPRQRQPPVLWFRQQNMPRKALATDSRLPRKWCAETKHNRAIANGCLRSSQELSRSLSPMPTADPPLIRQNLAANRRPFNREVDHGIAEH